MLIVGLGFVFTPTVAVPIQVPLLAVTVYIVLAVGDTTMLAPVVPTGCHVKPVAAAAQVNEAGFDAHTIEFELIAATCKGATVTVVNAVLVPHPFCPSNVYVVVTLGVIALPCVTPAFTHVYVNAPLPVNDTACPKQILLPVLVTVKFGTLLLTVN